MTEYKEIWARIRTKHSSGLGDWEFREFAVPANLVKKSRRLELNAWFKENIAAELDYELNTHSEHWRGIDWEFVDPPRRLIENRIKNLRTKIHNLQATIDRYTAELDNYKEQDKINPKKPRCRLFPECGCIKQFKTDDCREPYSDIDREFIARRDARRVQQG